MLIAIVHALKQFATICWVDIFQSSLTMHPCSGSLQKMEGLLARWALTIQEYNFNITYQTMAMQMLCLERQMLLQLYKYNCVQMN